MIYEENKDKKVYIYNVVYDREKLKEILEKLEKYSYVSIKKEHVAGNITRWPATKKNIQRRVIDFFYSIKRESKATLIPETIVHHTEFDCDFVTYEYSFEKLPDLYGYIDIIVNNQNIMNYKNLDYMDGIRKTDVFYMLNHKDQLVIEAILNYINSNELTINNSEANNNNKYDYKGLNELYKETLECLKFNLIAVKENVDDKEVISGLSLVKKK